MKKVLFALMIIAILLSMVACAPTHEHTVTGELIVVKEATCAEEGISHMFCSGCGEIMNELTIAKTDIHTETVIPAVESTCTEKGLTEGTKCSVCDKIIVAQQETPILAHKYDDKYDDTCNACGHVRDAECPHTQTEVILGKDATCTEIGYTDGVKCKKCEEILVSQNIIPAKSHVEAIDIAVEATCTSTGLTEGKHCSICNEVIIAQQETPIIAHNYVNHICQWCGKINPQYSLYVDELEQINAQYELDINNISAEISDLEASIEESNQILNESYEELGTLTPTAPSSYISAFVKEHGSEYPGSQYAIEAATKQWKEEYQAKKSYLEALINQQLLLIDDLQSKVSNLNIELYNRTLQWNTEVEILKTKYGIE